MGELVGKPSWAILLLGRDFEPPHVGLTRGHLHLHDSFFSCNTFSDTPLPTNAILSKILFFVDT